MTLMTSLRRAAITVHGGFISVLPSEFRRRYRAEMQIDFVEDLNACGTAGEVGLAAVRACGDLVVSAAREWWGSEALKPLICAGLAHTGIWLIGVAVAAWQWPGGSRLFPLVLTFALISAPGIAVAVWWQRLAARQLPLTLVR